jgi:hypothetical protein
VWGSGGRLGVEESFAVRPRDGGAPAFLLRHDRRQFEHAAIFGSFGDVAAAQREADGVELSRIVRRELGRPRGVVLDQIDRDVGGVFALG